MNYADIPIASSADDRLERDGLVKELARMLVRHEGTVRRATRLSVGLTGRWGSGKSSVLRLLAAHLGSLTDVLVVEFNPWVFQGRDDLMDAFFGEMRAQLGQSNSKRVRGIVEALDGYRDAIEPALNWMIPGAGVAAKAIPRLKPESALAKRRALEERLEAFDGAVVVLIDELDRIEDDEIRAMARLVKAIGDLPNISYLIGYDRARVEKALGKGNLDDGSAYLEKIIQFPVPLRPLVFDEVQEMLSDALKAKEYEPSLGDQELYDELLLRLGNILDTPRDVKRLAASFAGMEPLVRGEVNLVDLLGYAALCTKAAGVRDAIADELDDFVNDPADILQRIRKRRITDKATVEEVLGAVDLEITELIKFLFPVLGGKTDHERFGRIQHRRNLLTMLYLGDPPFQSTRKEVEAFWSKPDPQFLAIKRSAGALSDFFGLIHRLMPQLPNEFDGTAWLTLAKEVAHGTGKVRNQGRRIGTELREILVEFGARSADDKARAQTVVETLISAGDLALVPEIIRVHMFAHGLVPDFPSRGGPTVYTRDETRALLVREMPRYATFISSGAWVNSAHDTAAFFALEQGGGWDDDLREKFEEQLDEPGALVALAEVMVPPGWSLEKGTLDRFLSVERLAARLAQLKPPEDVWLALCVERLSHTVMGEDPDTAR